MFTKVTHIANTSQQVIWARVDYGYNGRHNAGLLRIPPSHCQKFEYPFLRMKVYISIDVEHEDGSKERVVDKLQRGGDTSVIVQPYLKVVDSEPGYVWKRKFVLNRI